MERTKGIPLALMPNVDIIIIPTLKFIVIRHLCLVFAVRSRCKAQRGNNYKEEIELQLCRVSRQNVIPSHTQAALTVICCGKSRF